MTGTPPSINPRMKGPEMSDGSFKGKLNIYVCDKCRGHVVTRDVDEGVTPFMMPCEATTACPGSMKSSMYRVFDQNMAESHQWYRPGPLELIAPHLQRHVQMGGLLLRKAAP